MLTVILLSALAMAEEPTFVDTADAGQQFDTPETHLSAELGGAMASGNAVYYTVNGLLNASHRFQRNQLAASASVNLGRGTLDADGDGVLSDTERAAPMVEIARKYQGEARYDRFIGKHGSLYVLGGALSDIYAGYDLRAHEQVGYSRVLVDKESTKLKAELGADVAEENYIAGVDPDFAMIYAARGMLAFSHDFNGTVGFSDELEVYENVIDPADLRLLNEASLSAKLSDILSVKLSNQLTFDNVPVEGFRKLDQITLVSLVATLL